MNDVYDILIIGGGPAGIYAATNAYIKGLKPLLIEASETLGGQPKVLYSQKIIQDYPSYINIKAYQLMDRLIEQLESYPVDVLLKVTLSSYIKQDDEFIVKLSNNKEIVAKSIIIATGAGLFKPNELEFDNIKHLTNIHYSIRSLDEYKDKHVVILGGGDSAVDWANEISSIAKTTTIIHRRNEFRANGDNVNKLTQNKVNILLDQTITKVEHHNLTIKSNVNEDLSNIKFDYLIVQYGQQIDQKQLSIFNGLNIDSSNRIPVGINQLTNLENIYAIGNICKYDGKPSSIICAHGEAVVAVRHILNRLRPYDKKTSF